MHQNPKRLTPGNGGKPRPPLSQTTVDGRLDLAVDRKVWDPRGRLYVLVISETFRSVLDLTRGTTSLSMRRGKEDVANA